MIIANPYGGLCNRLQVIASYYKFCKAEHRKLVVIWGINDELNCSLRQLFLIPPEITLIELNSYAKPVRIFWRVLHALLCGLPYLDHKASLPLIGQPFESEKMKILKKSAVFCEVCEPLSYEMKCDIYTPAPELLRIKENVVGNKEPYFGMHIRRSDFAKVHPETLQNSSDEYFEQIVEQERQKGDFSHAFLATDDVALKNKMLKKYAPFVFTQELTSFQRAETAGMIAGCVDLLCLSGAKKIYGTPGSSFSRVASLMGGAELILPE